MAEKSGGAPGAHRQDRSQMGMNDGQTGSAADTEMDADSRKPAEPEKDRPPGNPRGWARLPMFQAERPPLTEHRGCATLPGVRKVRNSLPSRQAVDTACFSWLPAIKQIYLVLECYLEDRLRRGFHRQRASRQPQVLFHRGGRQAHQHCDI